MVALRQRDTLVNAITKPSLSENIDYKAEMKRKANINSVYYLFCFRNSTRQKLKFCLGLKGISRMSAFFRSRATNADKLRNKPLEIPGFKKWLEYKGTEQCFWSINRRLHNRHTYVTSAKGCGPWRCKFEIVYNLIAYHDKRIILTFYHSNISVYIVLSADPLIILFLSETSC